MEVDKKYFLEALEKVYFGGHIYEVILNFEENGMRVNAQDKKMTSFVQVKLDKSAFSHYKPIGAVAIKDISFIIDVVRKFTKSVRINFNKDLMSIKEGNKEIIVKLAAAEFINESPNPETVEVPWKKSYPIKIEELRELSKDSSLFKEDEDILKTIFETNKGKMSITIDGGTGYDKIKKILDILAEGEINTAISVANFNALTSSLSGMVANVFLFNDAPMKVTENTGKIEAIYIIAEMSERPYEEEKEEIKEDTEEESE